MKSEKNAAIAIAIPLVTGALSRLLSRGGMAQFGDLNQPVLSPPGWLFPVVWTVLYVLMGIASYLVFVQPDSPRRTAALRVYGVQLFFNFFWSILFFRFGAYWAAFVWLILLWLLIVITMARFEGLSKTAVWLLVPYLLWVSFAGYLNAAVAQLN